MPDRYPLPKRLLIYLFLIVNLWWIIPFSFISWVGDKKRIIKAMYKYLGDRLTDLKYKGQECQAVQRANGKCIRARNGSMLVKFSSGETVVVIRRLLRKVKGA